MTQPAASPVRAAAVRVRPMVAADLPATLAWRNDERSRHWFTHAECLSADGHAAWFRGRDADPTDRMYIAERVSDGAAVAQAGLYRIDRTRAEAEVGRFLTDPALRGCGYFARLFDELLVLARDAHGLRRVVLVVMEHNARAIAIYHSRRFVVTGRANGMATMALDLR
jgi:RimJ/RimL family protein N-acetyltransferase